MPTNIMTMRGEELKVPLATRMVAVPLSFQLNGTSAPSNVRGLRCSVARSDTGLFTVTLPGTGPTVTAVFVGAPEVTGTKGGGSNSGIGLEAFGTPTSGTFGVRTMTGGTTTLIDVAASATVRVNCVLFIDGTDLRSKNT